LPPVCTSVCENGVVKRKLLLSPPPRNVFVVCRPVANTPPSSSPAGEDGQADGPAGQEEGAGGTQVKPQEVLYDVSILPCSSLSCSAYLQCPPTADLAEVYPARCMVSCAQPLGRTVGRAMSTADFGKNSAPCP